MVTMSAFEQLLHELLAPVGPITFRRMFGKKGVFSGGLMLGMVADDALYFRVDAHNRETFKEADGVPTLSYEKGGRTIPLSFWRAPERLLDEPEELATWARSALDAARRVAKSRSPKS